MLVNVTKRLGSGERAHTHFVDR